MEWTVILMPIMEGFLRNVWLHVTDKLYQTLPLYSNLKTTGVYIYAEDIRVKSRKAVVHAESEIKNEYNRIRKSLIRLKCVIVTGKA